jgi:uncharacterized membrane protein
LASIPPLPSSSLSDAKVLGGIGSILVLLTAVPNVGWLLGIVGFVLVLVAVKKISQTVNDKEIYGRMLTAVVLAIAAIAVGAVTIFGVVFRPLALGVTLSTLPSAIAAGNFLGLAALAIGGLVAVEVLLVLSAVFVRRSYDSVSDKLGVGMFRTAGLLYLIGAATAIVGVGFLLIFVAEILQAVAFFSIPDQPRVPLAGQAQSVATVTG